MPVGTYGTVKGVMPQSLHDMGAQIILGNTFHLWMRPGLDIMQSFGGLHGFEQWHKPILTDSGGFQVWSLGAMRKITEEGVHFASPVNGDKLFMSPEVSMQIQTILNSDIVMQLDECTPYWQGDQAAARPHHHRGRGAQEHGNEPALGQALTRPSSRAWATPTRCSASCRAACSSTCARSRWTRWWRWTSPATPLAA
jgi:tRNA-guanine family transglycosylase